MSIFTGDLLRRNCSIYFEAEAQKSLAEGKHLLAIAQIAIAVRNEKDYFLSLPTWALRRAIKSRNRIVALCFIGMMIQKQYSTLLINATEPNE